jgi:pimeloyl-ACP methyl ester carboxylesterase
VRSWPDYWYVWRLVMPALARDYEVIAVDQRGIGLTDKPRMGTTPTPSPATWSR